MAVSSARKVSSFSLSPPLQMLHLSGGLGFLLGSNNLGLFIAPGGMRRDPIQLPPKASVLPLLSAYKRIRVLGRTTFQNAEELRDPVTDNFIITARTAENKCLATNQERHWSGVANVLYEQGNASEAVLANRIASQIHLCIRRLERLSMAYRMVLTTVQLPDKPAVTSVTSITCDKYAHHIGTEYRSLLSELYNLRDAATTATFRLKYRRDEVFRACKDLKSAVAADPSEVGRLINSSMYDAAGDLLIKRMSLYRSVGQHYLGSNNPLFADAYQHRVATGPHGDYPYLVFPMYDDLERMRAIEKGVPLNRHSPEAEKEAARFLAKLDHLDALEFSFDCFVRLLRIAESLATSIKLESRHLTITDTDILDATFADETGKIARFKRDGTTGKLVEY